MSLRAVIRDLMLAETLEDVEEPIADLCELVGIDPPEGSYAEGWSWPDDESDDEPEPWH